MSSVIYLCIVCVFNVSGNINMSYKHNYIMFFIAFPSHMSVLQPIEIITMWRDRIIFHIKLSRRLSAVYVYILYWYDTYRKTYKPGEYGVNNLIHSGMRTQSKSLPESTGLPDLLPKPLSIRKKAR